jgi:hypothetical protein
MGGKSELQIEIVSKKLLGKLLNGNLNTAYTEHNADPVYGEEKSTSDTVPDIPAKNVNRDMSEALMQSNKKPSVVSIVKEAMAEFKIEKEDPSWQGWGRGFGSMSEEDRAAEQRGAALKRAEEAGKTQYGPKGSWDPTTTSSATIGQYTVPKSDYERGKDVLEDWGQMKTDKRVREMFPTERDKEMALKRIFPSERTSPAAYDVGGGVGEGIDPAMQIASASDRIAFPVTVGRSQDDPSNISDIASKTKGASDEIPDPENVLVDNPKRGPGAGTFPKKTIPVTVGSQQDESSLISDIASRRGTGTKIDSNGKNGGNGDGDPSPTKPGLAPTLQSEAGSPGSYSKFKVDDEGKRIPGEYQNYNKYGFTMDLKREDGRWVRDIQTIDPSIADRFFQGNEATAKRFFETASMDDLADRFGFTKSLDNGDNMNNINILNLVKEVVTDIKKAKTSKDTVGRLPRPRSEEPVEIPDYGYNREEDWQPDYEAQYGSGATYEDTGGGSYSGEYAPYGSEGGKGSAGRGRYWSPHQPGGRTVGKGLQKQVPPAMTTAPKKPPMATSATGPANVGGVNTGIPIKMSKGSKNKERQVPARKRPRPTSPKEIENMAKSALLKLEKQGPTPDPLYEKEVAERKVGGRGTEYQRVDAKVSNAQRLWDTGREADMPIHSGRYGKWGKDFGPVDYGPAQPGGGEITEERRINPAFSDGSKQGIKPKGPQLSDFPNPKNVLVDDPKRGSGSGSGTFPISEPQRDISTFDYDRKQSTIPSPGLGGKYKPNDRR